MNSERPFSQACENNKGPILAVLQQHCQTEGSLLEIGAGTGQHAAWLSARLPHLQWQPSDVADNLPGIRQWQQEPDNRSLPPLVLDVAGQWPTASYRYIFTANTFHILSAEQVRHCIAQCCQRLQHDGRLMVYGPFNYEGRYSSESNARFDQWLKSVDNLRGIRDQEWVVKEFARHGRQLIDDHAMPANNRVLVFG